MCDRSSNSQRTLLGNFPLRKTQRQLAPPGVDEAPVSRETPDRSRRRTRIHAHRRAPFVLSTFPRRLSVWHHLDVLVVLKNTNGSCFRQGSRCTAFCPKRPPILGTNHYRSGPERSQAAAARPGSTFRIRLSAVQRCIARSPGSRRVARRGQPKRNRFGLQSKKVIGA